MSDFNVGDILFGPSVVRTNMPTVMNIRSAADIQWLKQSFVRPSANTRVASIAKYAGDPNVLINKSTNDLWRIEADSEGGYTLQRLPVDNGSGISWD